MTEKKKVLLVVNIISDYRVETYNLINQVFDFTVAYDQADQTKQECKFRKLKLHSKKVGPFNVFGRKFWLECKKYDVVITLSDIHNFEFALIPFIPRKYKCIIWGIGFRCSYTRPYNVERKHQFMDKFSYLMMKCADANIFYMEKAREFWKATKLDQSGVFVATNTTKVIPVNLSHKKTSILFVGALYAAKGVDKLIAAFGEVIGNNEFTLDIVGKGDMLDQLQSQVTELKLNDKVIFHGSIYDENKLSHLFANALICVSPTQAGLTVPKSMGYGVPFVTRKDAITGGELYHIENGKTGVIYENDYELPRIIENAITNPYYYQQMGIRAQEYYVKNAQPKHQAEGVIKAIKYALGIK